MINVQDTNTKLVEVEFRLPLQPSTVIVSVHAEEACSLSAPNSKGPSRRGLQPRMVVVVQPQKCSYADNDWFSSARTCLAFCRTKKPCFLPMPIPFRSTIHYRNAQDTLLGTIEDGRSRDPLSRQLKPKTCVVNLACTQTAFESSTQFMQEAVQEVKDAFTECLSTRLNSLIHLSFSEDVKSVGHFQQHCSCQECSTSQS